MVLNDKYQSLSDQIEKSVEDNPQFSNSELLVHLNGLLIRQVLEVNQKLDDINKRMDSMRGKHDSQ